MQCSGELRCPGGGTGSDPHMKACYMCYNMHFLSNGYLITKNLQNPRNGEQNSFLAGDSLVSWLQCNAILAEYPLVLADLEHFLRLFTVGCKTPGSSCLSLGSRRCLPLVCSPQQAAAIHTHEDFHPWTSTAKK